jgi:hypothetical protein
MRASKFMEEIFNLFRRLILRWLCLSLADGWGREIRFVSGKQRPRQEKLDGSIDFLISLCWSKH